MAPRDIGEARQQKPLALPTGGTRTAIDPAAVSAVVGRVVDAYGNVWQGPGQPPAPTGAPGEQVRRFDYPVAWNVWRNPSTAKGSDGGIDFAILREFSKQTLVRLAIETCKNLDSQTEYIFTLKAAPNEKPGQTRKRATSDRRIQQVSDFFDSPDGIHDFPDWRRLAWEEILVADNLSIYRREFAFGGKNRPPHSLRVIDGDTIEPIIDAAGYEPEGDDVAYEQWIKGQPRTPFSTRELLYSTFNPRVKHVFGHSPTEQVLWYINILIRRDLKKLAEYTDGNIPAALWSSPDTWTPDHIQQAQTWFDNYLTGDPAARSKLIFVPGGSRQPVFPGERVAADSFDDLLARLICYAYNVSVSSLLKEQTRATAQVTKEQAEEEGVVIRRGQMTRLINRIIRWAFGYNDVICVAKQQLDQDAAKQSEIDDKQLTKGVKQVNEIREREGDEPIPELIDVYGYFTTNGFQTFEASIKAAEAAAERAANPPQPTVAPAAGGGDEPARGPVGKTAVKKNFTLRRPELIAEYRPGLADKIALFFKGQAHRLADEVRALYVAPVKKSAGDELTGEITIDWSGFVDLIRPALEAIYKKGGQQSFDELTSRPFDQLNELAASYARDRAAQLVGMKWVNGSLVENPNVKWSISQTTRDEIRVAVDRAIEEGMSPTDLATEIEGIVDDEARADLIAETELALAQGEGSMAGWRDSGVVIGKVWLLSNDHDFEDECDDNEAAGVIPIDDDFPSGDDTVPAHPNCLTPETLVAAAGVSTYFKRWFAGEIVRIRVESGDEISITPNHPVLTMRGWIAAGEIREGDDLFKCSDPRVAVLFLDPDNHHVPTVIEQVFRAGLMANKMAARSVPLTAEAFHGDAAGDGEVDVVNARGFLKNKRQTALAKLASHITFAARHPRWTLLAAERTFVHLVDRCLAAANCFVSAFDDAFAFSGAESLHSVFGHGNVIANGETELVKSVSQRGAVTPQRLRDLDRRFPGLVTTVKVTNLVRSEYEGHVYNLSTRDQFYFAAGLVVHNCYCDVAADVDDGDDIEGKTAHVSVAKMNSNHDERGRFTYAKGL